MASATSSEKPILDRFHELCAAVEAGVQQYRQTRDPKELPDVSRLWTQFILYMDVDTFLKPIVQACRKLVYDKIREDQQNSLAEALQEHIYQPIEKIQESVKDKVDLGCFLTWLTFHLVRLRGLTLEPADARKLNEWLRLCYDTEDNQIVHFFSLFGLSRDEEMRNLIFDERGRVRDFFRSEVAPGATYLPKLVGWFLRRYDLAAASERRQGGRIHQLDNDKG